MIRGLVVLNTEGRTLYQKIYTPLPGLDLSAALAMVNQVAGMMPEDRVEHTMLVRFRLSFCRARRLLFVLISDRVNNEEEIQRVMTQFILQFHNRFQSTLQLDKRDADLFKSFDENAAELAGSLPVKLSLAGFGGVGKTTMRKLLRREDIPMEYRPTMFGDTKPVAVGIEPYKLVLFDFAGQERFMVAWDLLIAGSEIVFVVVDSTPAGVRRTKEVILPLVRNKAPYAQVYVIANKQDLQGAMPASEIEREMGLPTFPLVAIRPESRERLIAILRHAIFQEPAITATTPIPLAGGAAVS